MKKKALAVVALSAVMAFSIGAGVVAQKYSESYVVKAGAEEQTDSSYEVDSIVIHPNSTDNTKLYMMLSTNEGEAVPTGYKGWVAADAATIALEAQILLNGEKMSEKDGVVLQGMDIVNGFCISGYYLPEGGTIVIPEGATFDNGIVSMVFARTFTITWNGEAYEVTRSAKEIVVPEYDMPDGMLSDFTKNAAVRLAGMDYSEAAVNDPGNCWITDYEAGKFQGRYISAEEAPDGSTNGGYEMRWETMTGLLHPSIMFTFPQDVEFNAEDDLVFRIYFSEDIDPSFNFWITSSLTPRVWEAQTIVSGLSLTLGEWNELRVSAADYMDQDGKIAPIAFTLNYDQVYSVNTDIPAGTVVFDTAVFEQVEKTLADEYEVLDVSAVVPVGDGITFTGEREEFSEDFDWSVDENIAFARTDKIVDGVSAKLTINDLSQFSFYFVLNGASQYYINGGVYYWFSDNGIKIGYNGKLLSEEALPSDIVAGKAFTVEMKSIPYYVEGMKGGNYVELLINGTLIGEGYYVSSANCNFGNWFGLYLHNTTKDVSVTVEPVEKSVGSPVSMTLSTSLNATQVKVGDSLATKVKTAGKIYGAGEVRYEIVSGDEYATVDEDGYINGLKDGEIVVRVSTTNVFGTFYSNEITVQIGAGLSQSTSVDGSGDGNGTGNSCSSFVSGIGCFGVAALGLVTVLKKKKENDR